MSNDTNTAAPASGVKAAPPPKPADSDPFGGIVAYVPPVAFMRRLIQRSEDGETVTMSLHTYRKLLECALLGVYDESDYLDAFPDVKKAVEAGDVPSAMFHFMVYGYAEGRPPRDYAVDEEWYLRKYPDIAAAVRDGKLPSGAFHFERFGYAEGRAPSAEYEQPVAEWRMVEKLSAKSQQR